jgi:hypothetical protein
VPQHLHIIDCERCRAAFRACVRSETFEEARKLIAQKST